MEPLTTVFIAGLPSDITEREFEKLFTFAIGFEGCSLRKSGDAPVGFARFCSPTACEAAIAILSRTTYDDSETPKPLRAEVAKTNLNLSATKRSQKRGAPDGGFAPSSRAAYPRVDQLSHGFNDPYKALVLSQGFSDPYKIPVYCPPVVPSNPAGLVIDNGGFGGAGYGGYGGGGGNISGGRSTYDTNSGGPPMCDTLFVRFIPLSGPVEQELHDLFSRQPGFRKMCYRDVGRGPTCFVAFTSTDFAANAIRTLNGTMLPSSTEKGLHLSYAKTSLN